VSKYIRERKELEWKTTKARKIQENLGREKKTKIGIGKKKDTEHMYSILQDMKPLKPKVPWREGNKINLEMHIW